jgi:hypothetical protein
MAKQNSTPHKKSHKKYVIKPPQDRVKVQRYIDSTHGFFIERLKIDSNIF